MSESRRARLILAGVDAGVWVVALCLTTWSAFDLDWSRLDATALVQGHCVVG